MVHSACGWLTMAMVGRAPSEGAQPPLSTDPAPPKPSQVRTNTPPPPTPRFSAHPIPLAAAPVVDAPTLHLGGRAVKRTPRPTPRGHVPHRGSVTLVALHTLTNAPNLFSTSKLSVSRPW